MEVIEHYRNIPDRLYSAVEVMFRNVVKELNEAAVPEEGRAMAARSRRSIARRCRMTGDGSVSEFHKGLEDGIARGRIFAVFVLGGQKAGAFCPHLFFVKTIR